jgi:type II secretory pathway pseudopilin PulG
LREENQSVKRKLARLGDAFFTAAYLGLGGLMLEIISKYPTGYREYVASLIILEIIVGILLSLYIWRLYVPIRRALHSRKNSESTAVECYSGLQESPQPSRFLKGSVARFTERFLRAPFGVAPLALCLLLFAVFAPSVAPPRIQSNESAAIGNLRTILGAEQAYNAATGRYASIEELTGTLPPYLDDYNHDWEGVKSGYCFTLTIGNDGKAFKAIAMPAVVKWQRGFYVDETGVIRFEKKGKEPDANSMPIGE